ncbi:MAG TPA: AbrB/MazE/SpoVT family DNA-binding domain-containing protein [Candidatus Moranbacteria bacterium]|nr:AbrB/MazE/SpoVT family DNA-binding domain-containing protein [Candidatus Moranbacteria bacterium]
MPKIKEEITKTYSARISSKGQVVLPKALRTAFSFNYGDVIDFEVVKTPTRKELIVKKAPTIFDLAGTLKPKKGIKPLKSENIRKYMEENYEKV